MGKYFISCFPVLAILILWSALPASAATYSQNGWNECSSWGSGDYDSAGNIYIACGTKIVVYGPTGNKLLDITPGIGDIWDVAPSNDGSRLYLAMGSSQPRRLTKVGINYQLDSLGTWSLQTYVGEYGWIAQPMGRYLDVDDSENIYLSDGAWVANGINTIGKWNSGGTFITNFGTKVPESWALGQFHGSPNGIVAKPDGSSVYVTDTNNSRIQRFDRQPNGINYLATTSFGNHSGMTDARGGYCYPDGGAIPSRMSAPYGIALDSAGNIYVHNTTCAQLIKFEPDHDFVEIVTWGTPADQAQNHSFTVSKDGSRIYLPEMQKLMVRDDGGPAAPDTSIHTGPAASTTLASASFTFSSTGTTTGFQCQLDFGAWEVCTSPRSYTGLATGGHVFNVRAMNGPTPDPSPASWSWTITGPGGPTCNGLAATVVGTQANVPVLGTPNSDVIVIAGNGEFDIRAGGGDDTICGGPRYDTIRPGSGNDWVLGGGSLNAIDYSDAGQGMSVDLAAGLATGLSSPESDSFSGFSEVFGGVHGDRLYGTQGDDFLAGNAGDDVIEGRGGNDKIWGDPNFDSSVGADVIDPGPGVDLVVAGPGADRISARDGEVDTIDCGSDADQVDADAGDLLSGCEGGFVPVTPVTPVTPVVPDGDPGGGDGGGVSLACVKARTALKKALKVRKKAVKARKSARGIKKKKKAGAAVARARKKVITSKRAVRRNCF